jgi:hypothetical protein
MVTEASFLCPAEALASKTFVDNDARTIEVPIRKR